MRRPCQKCNQIHDTFAPCATPHKDKFYVVIGVGCYYPVSEDDHFNPKDVIAECATYERAEYLCKACAFYDLKRRKKPNQTI